MKYNKLYYIKVRFSGAVFPRSNAHPSWWAVVTDGNRNIVCEINASIKALAGAHVDQLWFSFPSDRAITDRVWRVSRTLFRGQNTTTTLRADPSRSTDCIFGHRKSVVPYHHQTGSSIQRLTLLTLRVPEIISKVPQKTGGKSNRSLKVGHVRAHASDRFPLDLFLIIHNTFFSWHYSEGEQSLSPLLIIITIVIVAVAHKQWCSTVL